MATDFLLSLRHPRRPEPNVGLFYRGTLLGAKRKARAAFRDCPGEISVFSLEGERLAVIAPKKKRPYLRLV